MSKKKTKPNMAKKKAKAEQKRKQKKKESRKRESELIERNPRDLFSTDFYDRPFLADIEAPDEFIPVSISHAMFRFAQLIWEIDEFGDAESLDRYMKVSVSLWNYGETIRVGEPDHGIFDEASDLLKAVMNFSDEDIPTFIEKSVLIYTHNFIQDTHPEIPVVIFMRKGESVEIEEFDCDSLNFLDEEIEPTSHDISLLNNLKKIDKYVYSHKEYTLWKDECESTKGSCQRNYKIWLLKKGVGEYAEIFSDAIKSYLDYIYSFNHELETTLNDVMPEYLEEFYADYLMRFVIKKPQEYTLIPPAIRLFYYYLIEINYLNRNIYDDFFDILVELEDEFLDILFERYG